MKFIKWFLIVVALLLVTLAVIGYFLPKTAHVERSITVNANRDAVFTQVNSFKNFNQWSPWFDKDPNANYQYSGPESGVGNSMSWNSDKKEVGKGSQEIIESQYPSHVKAKLLFGKGGHKLVHVDYSNLYCLIFFSRTFLFKKILVSVVFEYLLIRDNIARA